VSAERSTIVGGRVVTPEGIHRADVAIEGERIVEVGAAVRPATHTIDATGLHLFPGLIDAHVHFNEPGREGWEGIASGSAALAAGGGTTFFDMPLNSDPPLLDVATFEAKRRAAESSSLTDFALWGGLTPDSVGDLERLAAAGVIGFKAFASDSGIPEFRAVDDRTLIAGMQRAAELGLPVALHAESDALTAALSARERAAGGRGARAYLASRPPSAEIEAVQRALLFAEEIGCALHLVHLSCARSVALVVEARARGVTVSCETCPHYLRFDEGDLERLGAPLKCAPPLRSSAERAALWELLRTGAIDLVASDHSPAPAELKGRGDLFEVWGGIAGVQSTLPALLDGPPGGGAPLPLERIAALIAEAPAQRFGLHAKGRIAPGHDADLALVDLGDHTELDAAQLLTRHKLSPYLGLRLRGRVRATLLRGRPLVRDGSVVAEPKGRLLRPARHP
jgi:allantoinase